MTNETDTIKAISQGNKDAFSQLYDSYSPTIYGLALRITESKERAMKVVEETFSKIWQRSSSFDPFQKDMFTWILEMAKETAHKYESRSEQFDFFAFQNSHSTGYSLEDLFSKIDNKHRQVLELAFFRKLSEEEIEETMNIPVGTVSTRLRLAIKAIREELG